MNQLKYIRMDRTYRRNLTNIDVRNLAIGGIGMFLFSSFVLNWGLRTMDRIAIFFIYLVCFTLAQYFYIYPLIMVFEGGYVSIFKKFKNIPINKRLFVNSKLILLTKFSIYYCLPVQLLHFWGLERTDTPSMSIIGFWPVIAMILTLCVQCIYIRILARDI